MRILFHGPGQTEFRTATPVAFSTGVPPVSSSVIGELKRSFSLTGNKGNIFHAEAPAKLFKKNEVRSCYASLVHLQNFYKGKFSDIVREWFDVVVLSMANFIRPNQDHSKLISAIEELHPETKIVVLGAGIQDNVVASDLTDSTKRLAQIFNYKATVFGVRGAETKQWLEQVGMKNAIVLGCPSLYVYPLSIMGISYEEIPKAPKIITAGHLSRPKLAGVNGTTRGIDLLNAFHDIEADYVFQDELFSFDPHMSTLGFYNEGTGECSSSIIKSYIKYLTGKDPLFKHYYYFHDSSAWRQMYRRYDIYIGDRFHGGVGAMQAGIPAIFLQHDRRVGELTSYFNLPTMTIGEFERVGQREAIAQKLTNEALSSFRSTYLQRFSNFCSVMSQHGLDVVNSELVEKMREEVA